MSARTMSSSSPSSSSSFTSSRHRDRAAHATVETLEDRKLFASVLAIPRPIPLPLPVGQTVDLINRPRQILADKLSGASNTDAFRVYLRQNEFLAVDVDPRGNILSTTNKPLMKASITVLNASGQIVPGTNPVAEPESGIMSATPAVGFRAPTSGYYTIKVGTTQTTSGQYSLELHRVGLAEGKQDAAALKATSGGMYVSLDTSGRLLLRGPTGYGFAVRGNWTQSLAASTNNRVAATYTASGPLFLQTAFGEVQFAVPDGQTFTVATKASTFAAAVGEVSSINTKVGLPLGSFAQSLRDRIGLDMSSISLGDKWSIQLGSKIKSDRGIEQALSAVPYIVYADKAGYRATFGQVTITKTTSDEATVLFADPTDPSLYLKSGDYAFQGSLQGLVPYTPYNGYATANTGGQIGEFFGHVHAKGNFPLAGLPLSVVGDVVVDLDANRDGNWLGLQGATAHQLFRGELFTPDKIESVIRDFNVGVNGGVNAGYQKGGFNFTVPLGRASVVYRGPQQGVWFKGGQVDPWQGTPLSVFQASTLTTIEGSIFRSGQFSVTGTNTYKVFGNRADLSVTLANNGVSILGKTRALGTNVNLSGQFLTNGNFTLKGNASLDFGAFDGTGAFELKRVGSATSFTVGLAGSAKWSKTIAGTKWTASASLSGKLTIKTLSSGSLSYSGSVKATGKVKSPIGSASFSLSASVNSNKLVFKFPKIGSKSLSLPTA